MTAGNDSSRPTDRDKPPGCPPNERALQLGDALGDRALSGGMTFLFLRLPGWVILCSRGRRTRGGGNGCFLGGLELLVHHIVKIGRNLGFEGHAFVGVRMHDGELGRMQA